MTVFLCGFMGCGKSTTGKILAKNLGLSYIDSDEFIVEQEGMTIPEIFEKKGEPYFRKVEAEVIKSLCGKNAVVSCGGGAMLKGFPELVTEAVGAPCYVADDPIECVAKGVAKAFDYTDELLDGFEKISLYRYK